MTIGINMGMFRPRRDKYNLWERKTILKKFDSDFELRACSEK